MNKFDKCKTCDKFRTCRYLELGEICDGKFYSTSYESTVDCVQVTTGDIDLTKDECDIRMDLIVNKKQISRLWGQVKDIEGTAVDSALVTLLKPQYIKGNLEYYPVATTISDHYGFYQFEIDNLEKKIKYRITVGKNNY